MSLNVKNFGVMAYSNGFTLWNYSTEDALDTLKTANYFNDVSPFSRAGDMILATSTASESAAGEILIITGINNNVVSVASLTASAAPAA